VPCRTLSEVFQMVDAGELDAGVVPVENSLAGSISETYDLLIKHESVAACGEIVTPVDHCLLAAPGTTIDSIRRVASHPQALAQCRDYLRALGVTELPYYDTAGAARALADHEAPSVAALNPATDAAIASARAAEAYGLAVLARSIQSAPGNCTRFYRIQRTPHSNASSACSACSSGSNSASTDPEPQPPSHDDPLGLHRIGGKTVLAVSLPHRPGSLFLALSSFACRSLNLTKIESRPAPGAPWHYTFVLEIEGWADDWRLQSALDELRSKSRACRVLGTFGSSPTRAKSEGEAAGEAAGDAAAPATTAGPGCHCPGGMQA